MSATLFGPTFSENTSDELGDVRVLSPSVTCPSAESAEVALMGRELFVGSVVGGEVSTTAMGMGLSPADPAATGATSVSISMEVAVATSGEALASVTEIAGAVIIDWVTEVTGEHMLSTSIMECLRARFRAELDAREDSGTSRFACTWGARSTTVKC